MDREVKPRRILLAVGFVVALAGVIFLALEGLEGGGRRSVRPSPPKAKKVDLSAFHIEGPARGEGQEAILISSPACPACRAYVPKVLEGAEGFSLYYKPVRYGKGSEDLEQALECVRRKRQGLFWEFLKLCYSRPASALLWLEERTSPEFVRSCLTDQESAQALAEHDREVRSIGVSAIPAVILGDELYQGGIAIEQVLLLKGG